MDEIRVEPMFRNTILSHGYGFIAQKLMRTKEITYQAKAIYAYLASFSGVKMECFPSVELMLKELGMTEDTFYKHLKILKTKGLVKTERIRTSNNKFKGTLYILIINESEIEEQIKIVEEIEGEKNSTSLTPEKGGMDNLTHTPVLEGLASEGEVSEVVQIGDIKVPDIKVPDIKYNHNNNKQCGDNWMPDFDFLEIPREASTIDPAFERVYKIYEREFGRALKGFDGENLQKIYDEVGEELAVHALRKSVARGIRNFSYIDGIVREWNKKGLRTIHEIQEEDKKFESKPKKGQGNSAKSVEEKPKSTKYEKFYITQN